MQSATLLLTESLSKTSDHIARSAGNLESIAGELEKIPEAGDLAEFSVLLQRCLTALRDEAVRHKTQHSAIQSDLARAGEKPHGSLTEIDPVTGLPGEIAGAKAVRDACARGDSSFAVAFAADRMQTLNLRYGFKAGDEILLVLAERIKQSLQPGDLLFRWRGPCFLLLLNRAMPESRVTVELNKTLGSKFTHMLTMGTREVVVQITGSWSTLPLSAQSDADDVLRRVDEFVVLRAGAAPPAAATGG